MLFFLSFIYCAIFLIYGCYTDIKTRRVSNKVWIYMLPGATVLFSLKLVHNFPQYLIKTILLVCTVFILAELVFYISNKAIGGADLKALIMIAFLFPLFQEFTISEYAFPILGIPPIPIFVVTVFNNALILTVLAFPVIFIRNLLRVGLKDVLNKPPQFFHTYKHDVKYISIPFFVPLTIGFFISIFAGDIFVWLLSLSQDYYVMVCLK